MIYEVYRVEFRLEGNLNPVLHQILVEEGHILTEADFLCKGVTTHLELHMGVTCSIILTDNFKSKVLSMRIPKVPEGLWDSKTKAWRR